MGGAVGVARAPARDWRGLGFSASAIGFLLVADQLLLPMFHFGSIPFKPTYLLAGLWGVTRLAQAPGWGMSDWQRRQFVNVAVVFGVIAGCAILGGLYFEARFGATNVALMAKNLTMFALVVLSFGIGLTATRFPMRWLIAALAIAIALNLMFIVLRSNLPGWLVQLYFPPMAVDNLAHLGGITNTSDLLELGRPRGMTSNPNSSAFMVNVIVLFIYCGLRLRLIPRPGAVVSTMVVFMPLALSMILASRGEFLSALVLGFLNFRLLFAGASGAWRLRLLLVCVVLAVAAGFAVNRIGLGEGLLQNIQRIARIVQILDQKSIEREGADVQTESVARPLLSAKEAGSRFTISPIFGSGYASMSGPPFEYGTEFFHNDWFWLAVTSGLLGVVAMLWFIVRYCLPLTPVLALPFVLPGLVNTFMLNIPVMMFYFFMVGVLTVEVHRRRQAAAADNPPAAGDARSV